MLHKPSTNGGLVVGLQSGAKSGAGVLIFRGRHVTR
jgi:hypothetical protein